MATMGEIPRLVIGGVASGVGKTTVTIGLAQALRSLGHSVALFKCGPDYLDPTYHRRVSGRECHNLDGWMMGRDAVVDTFVRGAEGADIALVEGVMGLFDGASATGEAGSTAEIAKWLDAPVLLVVDASGMARTIAAVVRGFAGFDESLAVRGVVCNRVGSRGHLGLLQQAQRHPAIVGGLPKDTEHTLPGRHLGLHTADETISDAVLGAWGTLAAEWFDIPAIWRLAAAAPLIGGSSAHAAHAQPAQPRCRIGLAYDEAFHFYYEDNLTRLASLGAELVRFSPIRDQALPEVDGLYLGGGYPELFAEQLSSNRSMIESIRRLAAGDRPIYAECGGLMYLSRSIRQTSGMVHAMVGLIPAEAVVSERLQALGYVEVETQVPSVLGPRGLRFRGHQFRYSELGAVDEAMACAYRVRKRRGGNTHSEGYGAGSVLGSYVHAHWASNPLVAQGFVDACAAVRAGAA